MITAAAVFLILVILLFMRTLPIMGACIILLLMYGMIWGWHG